MGTTKTAFALTMALSFLPIGSAIAEKKPAAVEEGLKVQINEMTCGEMLRQVGSPRDFTMIFMHGFVSGLKADTLFDAVAVSEATDVIYDMCVADTSANLLEVFKKARD